MHLIFSISAPRSGLAVKHFIDVGGKTDVRRRVKYINKQHLNTDIFHRF